MAKKMRQLGTAENATLAADQCHNYYTADGWTLIGQGAYRTALLGPDGVVYKVQHDSDAWHGEPSENEQEWLNFASYGALIFSETSGRVRLARSYYWPEHNVIAMEYVPVGSEAITLNGDSVFAKRVYHNGSDKLLGEVRRIADLQDLHGGNVWFDQNGILTVVDYAA